NYDGKDLLSYNMINRPGDPLSRNVQFRLAILPSSISQIFPALERRRYVRLFEDDLRFRAVFYNIPSIALFLPFLIAPANTHRLLFSPRAHVLLRFQINYRDATRECPCEFRTSWLPFPPRQSFALLPRLPLPCAPVLIGR